MKEIDRLELNNEVFRKFPFNILSMRFRSATTHALHRVENTEKLQFLIDFDKK